ncbi:MAG TPA: S41 family peptidase [Patescibacteria group bacterium]|jgi:carboxyl-terminal processing protease|nr:S41 family peptidase [Patescibacteria group bacterium]
MDNQENINSSQPHTEPHTETKPTLNPQQHATRKWILGGLILFIIIGGSFRLGYVSGAKGLTLDGKSLTVINKGDVPKVADYNLLWDAIKIVQSKYIDSSSIDPQKILYGAIRGAIAAAGDEYTQYFDPTAYSDFKTELQGSFSGIGAEIGESPDGIVIIAPLEDTPAAKAGLMPKDLVLKINGEATSGMTAEQAANKIRGAEGSQVTLTLFRAGGEDSFDVTLTRQKIAIKSVKLTYSEVNGKKIAVIKISKFGDDTEQLFNDAVKDVQKNNPAGVVLDLRNDPGGYLQTSVAVASQWLEKDKLIVKEAHSDSDVISYNSDGSNGLGKFKTVVLINGGSASAAEILAGALKDDGVAQLIGEKSFGKGSVQELIAFGPDKDMAVKVTVAKWITPGGKNLNKDGLDPDIKVDLTPDDAKNKRDPQMDRALQEVGK